MWILLVPLGAVLGILGYSIFEAATKPPRAPIDPAFSPPPTAAALPTQFTPGIGGGILELPTVPAGPNAPASPSGVGPIQVGDTVIVDIQKAGDLSNLPGIPPGQIPMFVTSLNAPGDFSNEMFLLDFVRPELIALFGSQTVRRSACRKAI